MPKIKLTDKKLKSLNTNKRMEDFWDKDFRDGSFGVRVFSSGKKSFTLMYRNNAAQQKRITIASYPSLSLADARGQAIDMMRNLAKGKDPAQKRDAFRQSSTFGELCDLFLEIHPKAKKLRLATINEYSRMIQSDIKPALGRFKISTITRRQILEVIESKAYKDKAPVLANRIRALTHSIFEFAIQRELVNGNPCAGLSSVAKETSRERYLNNKEITLYWRYLKNESNILSTFYKVLLLTGQRSGEVRQMRWEDIDFKKSTWLIPVEYSKNKKEHLVPLAATTRELLLKFSKQRAKNLFVFTSPITKRPIGWLRTSCNRIVAATGEHFTPHDIRRTVATHMAELGVSRHVLSKYLNHKSANNNVTGRYDRYDQWEEREEAVAKWEKKLKELNNDS